MLLHIHPVNPDFRKLKIVVECLMDGGVIAYPTDTIYGIGCDIFNKKAVERVCRIKKVDIKKHNFSFICYDLRHISDFTKQLETPTYKLMKKTLPGPFTFILKANTSIPKLFKNKKKTVGIRIPNNNIPREIVKLLGNPILTTSVKYSENKIEYTTNPDLIYEQLKNEVDIVISGGSGGTEASTIIDCTEKIEVKRQGKGDLSKYI